MEKCKLVIRPSLSYLEKREILERTLANPTEKLIGGLPGMIFFFKKYLQTVSFEDF